MPKSKRNLYGQFNTSDELSYFVINEINKIKKITGSVLEPSFGKGAFLNQLKNFNCNVTGVEIDMDIFNSYNNTNKFELYNEDYILFNLNKTYDFIIGNPPYIEVCYSFYSQFYKDMLKTYYSDISNGRLNLVHTFFKKSFEILNPDGIIAFLLHSAILTSPVYKKIRKIIYEHYDIELLIENVNFKNVAI